MRFLIFEALEIARDVVAFTFITCATVVVALALVLP